MTTVGQTDEKPTGRTLFGHPIGLANLFGVELWERFSFYGMLTILGYYLYYSVTEGGLELPKATATGIVGAYGGLVYLSTVLGGWIADRVLGMERTVFYGGVVVMCGHIALAIIPDLAGVAVGLVLVALGSGALKANASSLLGTLYEKGDPRCDGGFTLFYLGINLGAFVGPLITGLLQTRIGFHWGFGAAAVGMALGLAQYVFFRKNLGDHGRTVPNPLPRSGIKWAVIAAVAVVVVVVIAFVTGLVKLANLSQVTTGVIIVASIAYFVDHAHQLESGSGRTHSGAGIHPVVHRQRGVLVAVPADLHGARGLFGRADELVDLRVDGAVELDRIDRAGVDHPAVAAVRDHVDAAGKPSAHDAAQIRLRRDRHGHRLPVVPADGGHEGKAVPALYVAAVLAVFAVSELAAVADRAVGHDKACAGGVPGADDGAVLLLGRPRHVDVRGARQVLRPGTRIRLLRNHRRGRDRRGRGRVRAGAVDQPRDGGRALRVWLKLTLTSSTARRAPRHSTRLPRR